MPNSESVPFGGLGGPDGVLEGDMILKEIVPGSLAEYGELTVPERVKQSYDASHAAELFRVNCSVCHGLEMRGDSPIATMMQDKGMGPIPADLMARDNPRSPRRRNLRLHLPRRTPRLRPNRKGSRVPVPHARIPIPPLRSRTAGP